MALTEVLGNSLRSKQQWRRPEVGISHVRLKGEKGREIGKDYREAVAGEDAKDMNVL